MIRPFIRRFLSLRERLEAPRTSEHHHASDPKRPPSPKILVVFDPGLDTEAIWTTLSALRIAKLFARVELGALSAGEDREHAARGDVLLEAEVEVNPDLRPGGPYLGYHSEERLGGEHQTHL